MQKATSCPTQPFSPAKGAAFGVETSHSVCVSFQGAVVLGFTTATVSCLGLQSQNHNFKRTQLHQVIYKLLQDSPSLYQKAYPVIKFEWLCPLKVAVFLHSPKVTLISCYLIGLIIICYTGNPIVCSEFDLW